MAVTVEVIETPASLIRVPQKHHYYHLHEQSHKLLYISFTSSMWIGKTIGFVFQLVPFLIILRTNNHIVLVVLATIWIVRVVFCPTKESGTILSQLPTNDKTTTGLNSLDW